jgi:hypothetical protein
MTCSALSLISVLIVIIPLACIFFFLADPDGFLATVGAVGICLVLFAFILGLSLGVYKILSHYYPCDTGSCESSSSCATKENKQNTQISEIDKQIQKLQNQKKELEKKLSETK